MAEYSRNILPGADVESMWQPLGCHISARCHVILSPSSSLSPLLIADGGATVGLPFSSFLPSSSSPLGRVCCKRRERDPRTCVLQMARETSGPSPAARFSPPQHPTWQFTKKQPQIVSCRSYCGGHTPHLHSTDPLPSRHCFFLPPLAPLLCRFPAIIHPFRQLTQPAPTRPPPEPPISFASTFSPNFPLFTGSFTTSPLAQIPYLSPSSPSSQVCFPSTHTGNCRHSLTVFIAYPLCHHFSKTDIERGGRCSTHVLEGRRKKGGKKKRGVRRWCHRRQ